MGKAKVISTFIVCLFLANNIFAQYSWWPDYVPTIPADRRVDWHNVGDKVKPTYYNAIFNVLNYNAVPNDGSDDRQAIQNAIEAARNYISNNPGSYAAVYLPQGTYTLSSGGITMINSGGVDYGNICLKGDGSDKTILSYSSNYTGRAIEIRGYPPYSFNDVTGGYSKGSNIVTTNTSGINSGDYVELVDDRPLQFGQVGQILKVNTINGSQLTLEDAMAIDYNYNNNYPQLRKILPIKNVGIEDLKIEREVITGSTLGYTIFYQYAAGCWILGVESSLTYSRHVSIDASTAIEIRGSYFHDAIDYGGGGNGYGVEISNHSTNCLIEDNVFAHLRHSMMVQAGANRNVFAYNYSYDRIWEPDSWLISMWPISEWDAGSGDISVHGNYPYANLFEGNKVQLIWLDDWHSTVSRIYGFNGPYNTFIRNDISFGEIIVNSADYTNIVGNYADGVGVYSDNLPWYVGGGWGYSSNFVLDIAATSTYNGTSPTHHTYFSNLIYELYYICKDDSYYLDAEPAYFSQNSISFPPLGTAVDIQQNNNGNPIWPTATLPAYKRTISGGKYTLNGPAIVNFQNNFPGQGNGGNIIVSSNQISSPTSNFTVAFGNPIAASALTQTFNNVDFYFSNWSNGSQNISETFYPSTNTTYTANFIGKPANGNKNQHFNDIPGQNVIVYWDQHPNSNVTKYDIYRKVKHLGVMGPEFQIASINRVGAYPYTYFYTDYDFTITSSYTNDLVLYDVRQYYAPTSSYSDPTFLSIFGSLEAKPNLDLTPDKITQNITENSIDNYPNPFNPSTVIRYQIVNAGHVTLKVYDALGREVITLVDKEQASGRYEVNFNTSSVSGELASGLYIYKITANGFFAVKKMILTK